MVCRECSESTASPAALGGKNTQSVRVQLRNGIDEHCAHARAAGAVITRKPAEQFYGDRAYAARDPEGRIWSFGQAVRKVSREEAELPENRRVGVMHHAGVESRSALGIQGRIQGFGSLAPRRRGHLFI